MTNDMPGLAAAAVPQQRGPESRSDRWVGRLPILPRTYVSRTRLQNALDDAIGESGVTLLVAPAGAGKTLGVSGWLYDRRRGQHAIWLASAGELLVEDLEHATGAGDDDAGPPRLVVIDDAHELSLACVSWLDDRLNRAPEQLHVLLLARWDPPLSRLVPELLGHLRVLRGGLLKLDERETSYLVSQHTLTHSAAMVEAVAECAQGWCAAVVLTAKALAGTADPGTALWTHRPGLGVVDRVGGEAFAALTPRQRHVVLSVAAEPMVSPSLARQLSHDTAAGRILEELESTGLLVTRWTDSLQQLRRNRGTGAGPTEGPEAGPDEEEPRFVLHPLLVEVARQRLVAGGVDVERARTSVRNAVELDLERGEVRQALRRLVTVGDLETVTRVLSSQGPELVFQGQAQAINTFARHHPEVVEETPSCWFTLALERWQSGDLAKARSWLQRISTSHPEGLAADEVGVACTALMRGCLGDLPLQDAVVHGRKSLPRLEASGRGSGLPLALLRLLLGTAELRLGDLDAAERNLGFAADSRRRGLPRALSVQATAQLALLQLLRGREHSALLLARQASPVDAGAPTAEALRVVAELAAMQSVVQPALHEGDPRDDTMPVHDAVEEASSGDPVVDVLCRLVDARRLLLAGRPAGAARCLEAGLSGVEIPSPLRGPVLLERALQATLSADHDRLLRVATQLSSLGLPGESALVQGLRAELSDDLARAASCFAEAAETAVCEKPPTAALALVARAQVLDALGHRDQATRALQDALLATEVRRSVLPFLGWSRHGQPVSGLLAAVVRTDSPSWAAELLRLLDGYAGIGVLAGPMTATPQEQANVAEGASWYVTLSPRERDVLHELARGSTYADIAANLFVSENTVKTHVSSLYAKLGVNRRSNALAVARTQNLL